MSLWGPPFFSPAQTIPWSPTQALSSVKPPNSSQWQCPLHWVASVYMFAYPGLVCLVGFCTLRASCSAWYVVNAVGHGVRVDEEQQVVGMPSLQFWIGSVFSWTLDSLVMMSIGLHATLSLQRSPHLPMPVSISVFHTCCNILMIHPSEILSKMLAVLSPPGGVVKIYGRLSSMCFTWVISQLWELIVLLPLYTWRN